MGCAGKIMHPNLSLLYNLDHGGGHQKAGSWWQLAPKEKGERGGAMHAKVLLLNVHSHFTLFPKRGVNEEAIEKSPNITFRIVLPHAI